MRVESIGNATLSNADCRDTMRVMDENSGSTGKAALMEGFQFIGIDDDEAHGYFDIACARGRHATLSR